MKCSSGEKNDDGSYAAIGKEIMDRLSMALDDQADFSKTREEAIKAKGLDPQKVLALDVLPQQREIWGCRVLEAYNILSTESASTYVKNRKGPAEDDQWQFVLRSDRKTKAINSKQKVVLDSDYQPNDIIRGLIVTCGHEIEGHVIQAENKAIIPLRLFERIGGDRRVLLSEGGAVYNENLLIKEIFGYERPQTSFYLLAIEAKKRGGDYFDCLMMAYSFLLFSTRSKYDLNDPEQKERFRVELTNELKNLIPRIQRIFKGASLSGRSGYLPETKDTVYMEQGILMEKLAAKGLTKLAFVGGLNLRNIASLLKLGLLKLDDIVEPKMVTREIWEEIKDNYR